MICFYNLIAYDKLNLCDMHRKGSKKRLRTAVLKTVCEYYGVCTYVSHARHKSQHLLP